MGCSHYLRVMGLPLNSMESENLVWSALATGTLVLSHDEKRHASFHDPWKRKGNVRYDAASIGVCKCPLYYGNFLEENRT